MTGSQSNSFLQSISRFWRTAGFTIPIALLLVNLGLLWVPDQSSVLMLASRSLEDVSVFYWHHYGHYLFRLQVINCILVASLQVAWLFKATRQSQRYAPIVIGFIALLVFCMACSYYLIFFSARIFHHGTVRLDNNTYHLTAVYQPLQFDDPPLYFLGKCDQTGFWCEFHDIYGLRLSRLGGNQIEFDSDGEHVIIRVDGDVVYTHYEVPGD